MVSVVSLIMKYAIRANARRDNPAAGHQLRVPVRRATQVAMLTMEQAASLLEHTTEHYQPAMWLLIFTGARPAELCGCGWMNQQAVPAADELYEVYLEELRKEGLL
jgi:integrase